MSDEDVGASTHVVAVLGELDAASHLAFESLIDQVIDEGKTRVVIDLTEATFLDSTALSGLLAAARRLRRPDGALAVVASRHTQPSARFDLTGTGEVLNVCESREEALALVDDAPGPAREREDAPFRLRLYINGRSPHARRAVDALAELRRVHIPPGADVEVVDIADTPEVAERERLLATPALVRVSPEPVRRVIGDLSDHEQVLYALDLVRQPEESW